MKTKSDWKWKIVVFLFVISFFYCVIGVFTEYFTEPEQTVKHKRTVAKETETGNRAEARVFIQMVVKGRLKLPSTSDFAWLDSRVEPLGDNRYAMKSYVDSQNSFGSTVRTYFDCIAIKESGKWRIERLKIN